MTAILDRKIASGSRTSVSPDVENFDQATIKKLAVVVQQQTQTIARFEQEIQAREGRILGNNNKIAELEDTVKGGEAQRMKDQGRITQLETDQKKLKNNNCVLKTVVLVLAIILLVIILL